MSRMIRAHYDGLVIVPDEPVEIPVNQPLDVVLRPARTDVSHCNAASGAERGAVIDRLLSRSIPELKIPDWALSREHLYEDG